MQNAKLLFGSIIVIVLLGLYGYSLLEAISLARSIPKEGETLAQLNPGISRTLTTIGGLVSALVIAELAITQPGARTKGRLIVPDGILGTISEWIVTIVSVIYVLAWIVLGFLAFYFGEMRFPGKVPPLTDFAQAWLGLAVAAGYAYFGIKR